MMAGAVVRAPAYCRFSCRSCAAWQPPQTIAGRRRYLPDINSKSGQKRGAAERKAKNTVAQVRLCYAMGPVEHCAVEYGGRLVPSAQR